MTETLQPPHLDEASIEAFEEDLQDIADDTRPPWYRRAMEWRPGRKYKATVGAVAVATTVLVVQNADEINKWEAWNSDNHYPSAPNACAPYVDMERDLASQIMVDAPRLVSNVSEAVELEASGEQFVFNPDVADHNSSANEFKSSGVDLMESFRQMRDFSDHHIESFALSSGLTINVYSSVSDPSFEIDRQRFDELFHAPLDPNLQMSDVHYNELTNCTQEAFGFPASMADEELDVFILPETGYCIGHLRVLELPDAGEDEGCISQGSTPPQIKAEFLWWDLIHEEFMILTVKDKDTPDKQNLSINRILAHEAAHYWLNQTGRKFELDPEERYVEAIEETIRAQGLADINNPDQPAIIYRETD